MEKHPLLTWRTSEGLSQEQVGERLSVTRWTINSVETGRRQPSTDLAKRIEALTGISRHDLRPDIFGPAPSQGKAEAA